MLKLRNQSVATGLLAWLMLVCNTSGHAQTAGSIQHVAGAAGELAGELAAEESLDEDVRDLGNLSPTVRQRARYRLTLRGEEAREVLLAGATHQDLEIRSSCRQLLLMLVEANQERLLRKLLHSTATDIDLPCWDRFVEVAGDTAESRRLFAAMIREQPVAMAWLHTLSSEKSTESEYELLAVEEYLPLELARLNDGEPVRWAVLLLASQEPKLEMLPVLSSRMRSGLLSATVSQRLRQSQYGLTVQRLVGNWLTSASDHYINASMLKLALVYRCETIAVELAVKTLDCQHASPATVATALMLLARLQPEQARLELTRWLDDARVCHVWQVMATKRRAVQTQIGDVATALLLYLSHHDPRACGFLDIEADPDTIFREFSMGFEDEAARRSAYTEAHTLLGLMVK
jgi:hypothetical protein